MKIVFHSAFVGKRKKPINFAIINTEVPAVKTRIEVNVIGSISFTSTTKADKLNPHTAITTNNKIYIRVKIPPYFHMYSIMIDLNSLNPNTLYFNKST